MKDHVIIAPHADDEIIGCYELLKTGLVKQVFFCSETAVEEAISSSELYDFNAKHVDYLPMQMSLCYLFPDPTHEFHPLHRHFGQIGEAMVREGYDVIFYTTNMNTPYIHEVERNELKRFDLERCYSKKKSLWLMDHKYFLFEGYTKWIMQFDV